MYWENSVHFIAKKFHSPSGKETVQKLKNVSVSYLWSWSGIFYQCIAFGLTRSPQWIQLSVVDNGLSQINRFILKAKQCFVLQARKSIVLSDRLALVKTRHHIIWLMHWGKVYLRKGASCKGITKRVVTANIDYFWKRTNLIT